MTKIRHGKYIYNAEQAKEQMESYAAKIKELENIQTFVQAWSRKMLDNHQPYFNGPLDLSVSPAAALHKNLTTNLFKTLWCTACLNPWPCKRITELRVLRDALRNGADLTPAYEALDDFQQADHANTIPVYL